MRLAVRSEDRSAVTMGLGCTSEHGRELSHRIPQVTSAETLCVLARSAAIEPEGSSQKDVVSPLMRFFAPLATSPSAAGSPKRASHPRSFSDPRRFAHLTASLPYFMQASPMGFKERSVYSRPETLSPKSPKARSRAGDQETKLPVNHRRL